MPITYTSYTLEHLDALYKLSVSNNDVLKPNTKMLYFIIGKLFSDISFIALDNATLAGFVVCFEKNNTIWLHQLAVNKVYRKQGVATTLIKCLEKKVPGKNIEFSVKESNHKAIRLYENMGYKKLHHNDQIQQIVYRKTIKLQ
jgi:ribosomal protein S18 acetylase RimI-like enzyme